jgi:hypothetical protein
MAPTYQAASAGGAWTLLDTVTAANDATVEFTDLSSTHFMFQVVISALVPATDGVTFNMRTSTNNGVSFDSGASDYAYVAEEIELDGTENTVATGDDANSTISLAGLDRQLGSATNESGDFVITIVNPSSTSFTKVMCEGCFEDSAGLHNYVASRGVRLSAADVDAIQFLMSSGNVESGIFKLYGLSAS